MRHVIDDVNSLPEGRYARSQFDPTVLCHHAGDVYALANGGAWPYEAMKSVPRSTHIINGVQHVKLDVGPAVFMYGFGTPTSPSAPKPPEPPKAAKRVRGLE